MKYKLLKDLPGIKAGEIFEWSVNWWIHTNTGVSFMTLPFDPHNRYVFISFAKDHPEFFEPIVEKKKFEDLKEGDVIWIINTDWRVESILFMGHLSKHETFLTEHDAEMERLRREARANVYLPKEWEDFWFWNIYDNEGFKTRYDNIQLYYHEANSHRTKQDAEEYGRKYAKAFEIPNE